MDMIDLSRENYNKVLYKQVPLTIQRASIGNPWSPLGLINKNLKIY